MVATRHSLPSIALEKSVTPPAGNRKAANALKKLKINGKSTLYGDKKSEEQLAVDTFHYRGASYAVTNNTPSEWVENQPLRWKKRLSAGGDDEDSEPEVEEVPRNITNTNKKRSRAQSLEQMEEVTPKRTRRSAPEAHNTLSLDGANEGEEDTPRRTRRNLKEVYYGRPKRQPGGSTTNTPRKRRKTREPERPVSNSILYDYAVVGGRDEISCQEAKRQRAIFMGWEVGPIENQFDPNHWENVIGRKIANAIAGLIHVNTRIDKLVKEYNEVSEKLEASKQRQRQEKQKPAQKEQENTPKDVEEMNTSTLRGGRASEPPAASREGTAVEVPRARSASPRASARQLPDIPEAPPPRNASKSSEQDVPLGGNDGTIEPDLPRHDSATATNPSLDDIAAKLAREKPIFALPQMPDTNKGGDKLRWSLPANIKDPLRAEAAIHHTRMEGESRSARRRRVKRELSMIQEWATASSETTSQMDQSDTMLFSQAGGDDAASMFSHD